MNTNGSRLFQAAWIALWLLALGAMFAASPSAATIDPGDFLIRTTARISLGFWAVAVLLILRGQPAARLVWTLAWLAFLVHVATAFAYAHHWSHANAFRHVEEVSGFGPGIFVSYVFTLTWTADVLWWLLARASRDNRPGWLNCALHGFMVFIIFNSTVVYENGAIRWISAAALAALFAIWLCNPCRLGRKRSLRRDTNTG
jgi:hypothetical protein